jgi:hypothetical protein
MRLIGYVDGEEVKFDFTPPNRFTAVIPKQKDGIYIVELHASDEAGNSTSYFNIFVKIDFQHMTIKILPSTFGYVENGQGFGYREIEGYLTKPIADGFGYKEMQGYLFRELVM